MVAKVSNPDRMKRSFRALHLTSLRTKVIVAVAAGAMVGTHTALLISPILSLLGLCLFISVLLNTGVRSTTFICVVFYFVYLLFALHWMLDLSATPLGPSSLGLLAVCSTVVSLIFAASFALLKALWRWSTASIAYVVFLIPASWTLQEYLRSEFLASGTPWAILSVDFLDTPFEGFLSVFGSLGTTYLIIMVVGLFVAVVSLSRSVFGMVTSFGILMAVIAIGQIMSKYSWVSPDGDPIRVAAIGTDTLDRAEEREGAEKLAQFLDGLLLHGEDADLILGPETLLAPRKFKCVSDVVKTSLELIGSSADVAVGFINYEGESPPKRFNTFGSMTSENSFYQKNVLVPFFEYTPYLLRQINAFATDDSQKSFDPGPTGQGPISTGSFNVGVMICYEVLGLNAAQQYASDGVDFLVVPSSDGAFRDQSIARQLINAARVKSIESGKYLVRSSSNYYSAIIDYKGDLLEVSARYGESVSGDIYRTSGLTPFVLMGKFSVLASVAVSCFIILMVRLSSTVKCRWA